MLDGIRTLDLILIEVLDMLMSSSVIMVCEIEASFEILTSIVISQLSSLNFIVFKIILVD